jgi:mono/diheme cytochrome c family protein
MRRTSSLIFIGYVDASAMRLLLGLVAFSLVLIAGAAGFVYSGIYDTAATDQHSAPVFWVLKTVMRRAVHHHARAVHVPALDEPVRIAAGRVLYHTHCVRCHGAPGVAREPFALGLRPIPANLANTAIEWSAGDLFWTIKHGLKMTGMPAWEFRLTDDVIWTIVAYLQVLPYESPRAYRNELRATTPSASMHDDAGVAGNQDLSMNGAEHDTGDAERGRHVLQQYACIACHEIPGVVGASVPVGPPLDHMALRSFIAGVIENTPRNMVRWLRMPQQFVPDGAMPNLGVSEQDARDMAAYLESLR